MIVHPDTLQIIVTQPDSLHLALSVAQADTVNAVTVYRGWWEWIPSAALVLVGFLTWRATSQLADVSKRQIALTQDTYQRTIKTDLEVRLEYAEKEVFVVITNKGKPAKLNMIEFYADGDVQPIYKFYVEPARLYPTQDVLMDTDSFRIFIAFKGTLYRLLVERGYENSHSVSCKLTTDGGHQFRSLTEIPIAQLKAKEEPPAESKTPPGV